MDDIEREEIKLKLNACESEFGLDVMENAVIISVHEIDHCCGVRNVFAPTVTPPTLGNVPFKVARFFEDA